MTDLQPTETKNLSLEKYGLEALSWERARDILAKGSQGPVVTFFVGTVRPDGRPHAAGVGAVWHDGDLYVTTSPVSRKARNLDADARCTISARLQSIDLVLEGEARRTTDAQTLADVANVYNTGGWPCRVEGDALTAPYSAPSAGPPPWHVLRFTFHTAFGVATQEPYGATRWRFGR